MSWVRSRRWVESQRRWTTGKIHWMTGPWVTRCGQEITDDWLPFDRMPSPSWPGLCKACAR